MEQGLRPMGHQVWMREVYSLGSVGSLHPGAQCDHVGAAVPTVLFGLGC